MLYIIKKDNPVTRIEFRKQYNSENESESESEISPLEANPQRAVNPSVKHVFE